MGNKESDATEVKVFNIVKNVPIVSQLYRIPRTIVYAAKDNKQQTKRSLEFKVENLNPLKCIGGVTRGFVALGVDLQKGIWIGKRPLASEWLPISLNFSPGADLMHWAVMIDGVIYQVIGKNSNKVCEYQITTSEREKQTFHWYATDLRTSYSRRQIENYIDGEKRKKKLYSILAVGNSENSNCQMFILRLLQTICNMTKTEMMQQILFLADGTILL